MMNLVKRLLIICLIMSVLAVIRFTLLYDDNSDTYSTQPKLNLEADVVRRANATFIMLVRNKELQGALSSIKELEERFNSRYGYPYVFLNDEPFSEDFKSQILGAVNSTAEFGQIPYEHWNQPSWINETVASKARERMAIDGVKYGDSISYRNMCRFNSGFFFKHELMQKYKWYWRVEPSVHFHCNINYDPFLFMEDNSKVYSFTIATYEIMQSIPTLWMNVKEFMKLHPEHIAERNSMNFLTLYGGPRYSGCHFWSNFELADMDFWRSKAYTDYFEYLDSKGGFYYERWGDAPVHSIAVSLMLPRDKIHFFEDIGYQHDSWSHCPLAEVCDRSNSFDYDQSSCKNVWDDNVRQLQR
ncbi:glycosyltransferase family 15 protein [Cyathus striatus]|nr:glycosyltransferase family 15 protein [Cyathus striatus]